MFALMWEIKDGFMYWEDMGRWGGDGFSIKDFLADMVGMALAQITLEVFDSRFYIRSCRNGLSLEYRF